MYEGSGAYPFFLRVTAPASDGTYVVELSNDRGNNASAQLPLNPSRPVGQWGSQVELLAGYRKGGEHMPTPGALLALGDDLFKWLFCETALYPAWTALRQAAEGRPLHLTVEYGEQTHDFAALPLELLTVNGQWLFTRPGAGVVRTYLNLPAHELAIPRKPRLLFVSACPPGAGAQFDPSPHIHKLHSVLGDQLTCLPEHATLRRLREALQSGSYDGVHLLVHGWRELNHGGVVFADEQGQPTRLSADALAAELRGHGLRFAFLCSCQTATGTSFVSTGQHLLSPDGADIPYVVACQGNLPIYGSDTLVERFYSRLHEGDTPSAALSTARRDAYGERPYWSVPVLLSRPARRSTSPESTAPDLPPRPSVYLDRPELIREVVSHLEQSRLVSIVGLPGIGKTIIGDEAARQVRRRFDAVWRCPLSQGTTLDLLRALLSSQVLQLTEPPANDVALGLALSRKGRFLILLDNAEDLMLNEADQDAFSDFLRTLFETAPRLKVLLTTRWQVGGTGTPERIVHIPPLTPLQAEALLQQEMQRGGVIETSWPGSDEWKKILGYIDHHPRTLALTATQVVRCWQGAHRENALAHVNRLLEERRAEAIVDHSMIGSKRAYDTLPDADKHRMKSLVASMALSFLTLRERHPDAATLFLALTLYPDGLPVRVAQAIGSAAALDRIFDWNLLGWERERCRFPIPIQWYGAWVRQKEQMDELPWHQRTIEALAPHLEAYASRMTKGALVAGVQGILAETLTLEILEQVPLPLPSPRGYAPLAHLVVAAHQGLFYDHRFLNLDRRLLEKALPHAGAAGDRGNQANMFHCLGDLRLRMDDLDGALQAYDEALTIFREIQQRLGEANTLKSLGDLRMRVDDLDGARQTYDAALTIFQEIRERLGEANTLKSLGDLRMRVDDLDGARQAYDTALHIYGEIQQRLGEANTLKSLGDLRMRLEDIDGAQQDYDEALAIFREIQDRMGKANTLRSLGDLRMRLKDLDGAQRAYDEALPIFREIQARLDEANTLKSLGDLRMRVSDLDGARRAYDEVLPIFRKSQDRMGEANTLQGLGLLMLAEGKVQAAFTQFLGVFQIFLEIKDRMGQQAALGYLAQSCAAAQRYEQALLLAELSLQVGRQIQDRFGQSISLGLQQRCFENLQDTSRMLTTTLVLRELVDARTRQEMDEWLAMVRPHFSAEDWTALTANPELYRRQAVQAVEARFVGDIEAWQE